MDAAQRKNLTDQLSRISAAIAGDLRERMLELGAVNERARQLHADEQVGGCWRTARAVSFGGVRIARHAR